jgi:hypothetical protein
MSKGRVETFLGLYDAILKDYAVHYPDDHLEISRDRTHLISLSKTKGIALFTILLPKLGKVLDSSLSSGLLIWHGEPLSGSRHPGSMVPRLFWGLWSRLFYDDGRLKQAVDPSVVFLLRELLYVAKKFKDECAPKYLFEETKEYHAIDSTLPIPSPKWDRDWNDLSHTDPGHMCDLVRSDSDQGELFERTVHADVRLLDTLQRVADIVSASYGQFLPSEWRFKHGPGAVSDAKTGSFKYKFPTWSQRLQAIFPFEEFGLPSISSVEDSSSYPSDAEQHSKHIAVPKTQTGPRLIASEPTCNQWSQQCIRDYLYTRTSGKRHPLRDSISFHDQAPSRTLALLGSKTGLYSTIDLKSASDRVSTWLVERVFRRNKSLLDALIASRTRYLFNPIDKKLPTHVKLRKFSTQGSALTFPIQSIVFSCICIAVGHHLRGIESPTIRSVHKIGKQVRVFGDDLIVPSNWVPLVVETLQSLFLRVNVSKTHSKGNFRESCGMDAYMGYDVTPAYLRAFYQESAPSTTASLVTVSNNFFTKGLWHVADWIRSTLPRHIRDDIPVVSSRSGVSGWISYVGPQIKTRNRFNPNTHVWETLCLQLRSKVRRVHQGGFESLLQYFTEAPSAEIFWQSGVDSKSTPVLRRGWVQVNDMH